ncbi:MAG: YlmH/Sll1252 family protein [Bacilli bacterium]
MKNINYYIENNIERLLNGNATDFLLPSEAKLVTSKLKSSEYKVYKPYLEADKVILYVNNLPSISLFQIKSKETLRHQDILGALFNQGISNNSFGDIIIDNGKYYFYILSKLDDFINKNLVKIGNKSVSLTKIDIAYLSNYQKKYESYEIIVPSLRLDVILSNVIKTSRKEVSNLIDNKKVIVNYEVNTKKTYFVKDGDIFSIHKYGKYKFIKVAKTTKKNKLVVEYIKYI